MKQRRRRKWVKITVTALLLVATLIILSAVGHNIAMKRMYSLEYQSFVELHSSAYEVEASLVFAVIRCESSFDPEAKSLAGARGLMQLTEETFYDVRKMLGDGEEITYDSHWNDPDINIKYGTKYISFLIKYYDGDIVAALAAYNAGLGNVNDWLGADERLEIGEIEFPETEAYVNKVLESQKNYKKLLKEGE